MSDQVQQWLDEGRRQEQAGAYEAACQAYRKANELDPRNEEAWLGLGRNLTRARQWDEVQAVCLKALHLLSERRAEGEVAPEVLGQLYQWLAQVYSWQGRPEDVILELKLAAHYLPNHARVHHDLGLVCREEGRLEEAVRYLARALVLQYDAPDTLGAFRSAWAQRQASLARKLVPSAREAFDKGLTLYFKRQFAEALSLFQAALKAAPDHAEAGSYAGLCRLALQDPAGLSLVEQAVPMAPDNAVVLKNLAWCYANAGRWEEATDLYLRAVQAQPTYVAAYVELSLLYQQQGRWVEAFEFLKRARYFDQEKMLDPQTLLTLCENWARAEPQNARAHYELARRYLMADNWLAAIGELTTALLNGYDQTSVYIYLSLALLETKDWARAAQSLKSVLAQQPEQSLFHTMLAYVSFIGLKDNQQALTECEQALNTLGQSTGRPVSAAYRHLVARMHLKIKHPSRDDQAFWTAVRRQIKAEVTHGL